MLSHQAPPTSQALVALLVVFPALAGNDGGLLAAPAHNPRTAPVAHQALPQVVAIWTKHGCLVNQELNTIKTFVTGKTSETSRVEFLVHGCKNSFQHGQATVITFVLALLVVLLTDVLPILPGEELAHDGLVTDAADKAVGVEGDSIDGERARLERKVAGRADGQSNLPVSLTVVIALYLVVPAL